MNINKLQATVIDALENVKAQDIEVFDTTHLTSLFDRVVIASGTSNRQTRALASSVRDKVKAGGGEVISTEGEDTGEWVLVDLGDMIVHIMQPAIRTYYRLEEIWGGKEAARQASASDTPVRIRRTRAQAEAVAASQARHEEDDAPPRTACKPRTSSAAGAPKKTPARRAARPKA